MRCPLQMVLPVVTLFFLGSARRFGIAQMVNNHFATAFDLPDRNTPTFRTQLARFLDVVDCATETLSFELILADPSERDKRTVFQSLQYLRCSLGMLQEVSQTVLSVFYVFGWGHTQFYWRTLQDKSKHSGQQSSCRLVRFSPPIRYRLRFARNS